MSLRREKGWGRQVIAGYMGTRGVKVGSMAVHRILCGEGLNRSLTKLRIKRTYRRWQRKRPNILWQCDLKQIEAKWLVTLTEDTAAL